jgi:acyl carrier protein
MGPPRKRVASLDQESSVCVVGVLGDVSADCEVELDDPISRGTRLVAGLAFESTDVLEVAVALEQAFGRPTVSFDQFLAGEGRQVEDLTVAEVADFVIRHV